jgi:ABC-type transporter Mla maintaining outer membrane lipid asymmetry ATPase subunit MlaF
MSKRVGLARTLVLNPKLLLTDEPTSGLAQTRDGTRTGGIVLQINHSPELKTRSLQSIVVAGSRRCRQALV